MRGAWDAIGGWADSASYHLVTRPPWRGRRRRAIGDALELALRDAFSECPDAYAVRDYLDLVRLSWRRVLFFGGLLAVGLAYAGDSVGGHKGRFVGLGIGLFLPTAALLGEFDCIARILPVSRAQRLQKAGHEPSDPEVQRLLRLSGRNHGLLLIQVAAGLAVALAVALAR